jgi:hypothetical protein
MNLHISLERHLSVPETPPPVTTPEAEPTVATRLLLLLHVPPPGASVSDIVPPVHTVVAPIIADGNGLTVTTVVVKQPEGKVYVIVAVPVDGPVVTKPEDETAAIPGALLPQVPDETALLNCDV